MKRLLILLALTALAFPASSYAQTNLSDNFAKASLRALFAIETDSSMGSRTEDSYAQQMSSRATEERISDADVEAQTDTEKAVVKLLRNFSFAKTMNNIERASIASLQRMEANVTRRVPKIPSDRELALAASEGACSDAIEKALRARNLPGSLPTCDTDLVTGKKP